MIILDQVSNNYTGDPARRGTMVYSLIRRDSEEFGVLWYAYLSGGWPVLTGSERIKDEAKARALWERAKTEMRQRYGRCIPWSETVAGRKFMEEKGQ
jgi:hypothetical protein